MSYTCVITDDEPIALEILEDYVRMEPGLELVASCRNAMETLAVLQHRKVDLLFLDIRMPRISGLEMMRTLPEPPAVILTTAYPDYALEGFELDVVDYLLKPIAIDRFLRAVGKFRARSASTGTGSAESPGFLFVRSRGKWVKLAHADIRYIEGLENYVRIHLEDKVLISLNTMKSIEEGLPNRDFLRVHRSYIVNLARPEGVGHQLLHIGARAIPVGRSYRMRVASRLKDFLI